MNIRLISLLQLAVETGVLGLACAIALANGRRLFGAALGLILLRPLIRLVLLIPPWWGPPGQGAFIAMSFANWARIAGFIALLCGIAALGKAQKQDRPMAAVR